MIVYFFKCPHLTDRFGSGVLHTKWASKIALLVAL